MGLTLKAETSNRVSEVILPPRAGRNEVCQPANQEVWYLLGKVHMKLSEQALSKLNELDRNSVWVHEISDEIMEGMKNFDGALVEYKKAVEMAPEQAGTHYALSNAYWSL
jgi:tetratricopeptide (TPR) repeat protein